MLTVGRPHLKKYGYVLIPDALTEEEIETYTDLFDQWYAKKTTKKPSHPNYVEDDPSTHGFNKEDPKSYRDSNYLIALHGIIKNYGVGWTECQHYIRTRPVVLYLFALIHGTGQLYSSLDGLCYFPDRAKTAANRKSGKPPGENSDGWLHADLDPRFNRNCGALQIQVVGTDGEHLRLIPKSNKKDHSGLVGLDAHESHFYKPKKPTVGFLPAESVVVKAKKGGIIIWFSNTAHSGTCMGQGRLTTYVCMHPKRFLTPADLKRFQEKIVPGQRTTNHWGTGMNAPNAQTYGDPARDPAFLESAGDGYADFKETATTTEAESAEIIYCESEGSVLGLGTAAPLFPEIISLSEGRKELAVKRKAHRALNKKDTDKKKQRVAGN